MTWLAVLRLLLGLADTVLGYVREKQLIEAGEAKAIAANLKASIDVMEKARKARDAAVADFDRRGGVPDEHDPNLRD